MVNRITPKQISEMKKLKEEGMSYPDISIKLKIKYHSVVYHLNDNYRKKTIDRVKRNRSTVDVEKSREYHRKYQKERYALDPVFRKKQQDLSRKYKQNKSKEKENENSNTSK